MLRAPAPFPEGSLTHLTAAEVAAEWELTAILKLRAAGVAWHGVAVPAAFEEAFYRLNNLPARLLELYRGLDPLDPDEDIVEEAEPRAMALIAQNYLLDESVDLFYDSIAWRGPTLLRRPGSDASREAPTKRAALLALKKTYEDDWRVDAVMARLATQGALGLEARPVLLTPSPVKPDPELGRRASTALGERVDAWSDAGGRLSRLRPA